MVQNLRFLMVFRCCSCTVLNASSISFFICLPFLHNFTQEEMLSRIQMGPAFDDRGMGVFRVNHFLLFCQRGGHVLEGGT